MKPSEEIRAATGNRMQGYDNSDLVPEILDWLDAHFAPQTEPPQDAEGERLLGDFEESARLHSLAVVQHRGASAIRDAGESRDAARTALLDYIAGLRRARRGDAELSRDLTAQAVIAEANGHAAAAVLFRRAAEALGGKL